jgi:hypothetical protein
METMETCLAESHAAAVKHNVITIEKAMGYDKEVSPAHNRDGGKAKGERPRNAAHERQSRCRKAT